MNTLSPRTEIATLGEFGLIDRLTHGITPRHDTTLLGIGDDAAAIRHSADRLTLVTTDLLLEGVHFDLTYTPLKHLGYKTAVVNFSDIYAMNGRPTQLLVALGLSSGRGADYIASSRVIRRRGTKGIRRRFFFFSERASSSGVIIPDWTRLSSRSSA